MTQGMGWRRTTVLVKTLVAAGIAAAGVGGSSMVAHAYPPPHEHESIECSKDEVNPGGSCRITYVDEDDKSRNRGGGQQICFTVKPERGHREPACTTTDRHGKAFAVFTASAKACSGKGSEDGEHRVTIIGTETATHASARTTVQVQCEAKDEGGDTKTTTNSGSGGDTQHRDARC